MRRKDREVTDKNQIEEILKQCKTCHVAMVDNEKPYVGMKNFKGDYITIDDVKIAKNYLSEIELQRLNLFFRLCRIAISLSQCKRWEKNKYFKKEPKCML